MNNYSFQELIKEVSKQRPQRKGFTQNRKTKFSISDRRINELYDRYFSELSINNRSFTFIVNAKDLNEVIYLLRAHFQLWIDIEELKIIIYQEFPERFRVIKEVNKENHWFTPKTFAKGSMLHYGEDHYSVCNRINGIPLSELAPRKDLEKNRPVVQINYDFIEVVDDLF